MDRIKVAFTPISEPILIDIPRFEHLFGIRYLHHLEFSDWRLEQWVKKKCTKALKKQKVTEFSRWLGQYHRYEILNGGISDVTIRWIDDKIGYGVYTNQPLKQWQFVGEYTGLLRKRTLLLPELNDYCFAYPKKWISLNHLTIDSQDQGNFTRYINHSNVPNMESISVFLDGYYHIVFRAIQDIPAGTQLTYDYGDDYWSPKNQPQVLT